MPGLLKPGVYFMSGNVAAAEAALIAGCRFYAGYPITPASPLMEHTARRLPQVGGVFIQAEDEIAAIVMALGASAGGLKSMTATSGPGFSLMQEALGMGFMLELPVVIVDVQRGGPSTGLPTLGSQGDSMQAKWGTHGDYETVIFAPSTPQELFDMVIQAFNTSEMLRTPVVVLTDQFTTHSYGRIRVPPLEEIEIVDRRIAEKREGYLPYAAEDLVPPFAPPGRGYRFHLESLYHDERGYPTMDREKVRGLITRLVRKVREGAKRLRRYEVLDTDRADAVIVAYGSVARVAKEVVYRARRRGLKLGLFRPLILWPFPYEELRGFVEKVGADRVVVIEVNMGQVYHYVREALGPGIRVELYAETPGFYPAPSPLLSFVEKVVGGGGA